MENPATQAKNDLNPSLKFVLAMAIIQSRLRKKLPSSSSSNGDPLRAFCSTASESDAIKWKRKAKQRKEEILRLKEDLKIAEDGMQYGDVFPQNALCKCYFFDNLGELSPEFSIDSSESDQKRFNDVLRRRFLRQVRLSDRKMRRLEGTGERSLIPDNIGINNLDQLRASIDFLVDLCETPSPLRADEGKFKNWSHQAVDFILATLKVLLWAGKIDEVVESILSSLIVRLLHRMCNSSQGKDSHYSQQNFEFYVQHLMRKLGREPYIGQHIILAVSHRISVVAESLLFMDPFDVAFPKMHNCMYIMIQLIEFLVSDYLLSWSTSQDFDIKLLEEWVASIFKARKTLELMESRNALYMLYMDRVIGELTRKLGQVSLLQKLPLDTLTKFFG